MGRYEDQEYEDLYKVIPEAWDKFSYSNYWKDETNVLEPALQAVGYTDVVFMDGERDSFGPLSRVVRAKKDGQTHYFIYG